MTVLLNPFLFDQAPSNIAEARAVTAGRALGVGGYIKEAVAVASAIGNSSCVFASVKEGVGSASGVGTANSDTLVYAGAGNATASGTSGVIGSSMFGGRGVAAAVGSAAGTGRSEIVRVFAAAGVGTGTGRGSMLYPSEGVAEGSSTVDFVGKEMFFQIGTYAASGSGVAEGTCVSYAAGLASSSGTGASNYRLTNMQPAVAAASSAGSTSMVGQKLLWAVGGATGFTTAAADGYKINSSQAQASATGAAAATGRRTAQAVANASGTGASLVRLSYIAASQASANASGAASSAGVPISWTRGQAAGIGAAVADLMKIASSRAQASATGASAVIGLRDSEGVGLAAGTGSSFVRGSVIAPAEASASASGAASSIGSSVLPAVGSASGTGTFTTVPEVIFSAIAQASGTGVAVADIGSGVGSAPAVGTASAEGVRVIEFPEFYNAGTPIGGSSLSITPQLPTTRVNGNLLIAVAAWRVGTGTTVSTSTAGWTKLSQLAGGGASTGVTAGIFYRYVDGTETAPTLSFGTSSGNRAIVLQYTNVNQTVPFASAVTNTGSTAPTTLSALTSSQKNALAMYIIASRNTALNTPTPANYEERIDTQTDVGLIIGDQLALIEGTASDPISISGAAPWVAWLQQLNGTNVVTAGVAAATGVGASVVRTSTVKNATAIASGTGVSSVIATRDAVGEASGIGSANARAVDLAIAEAFGVGSAQGDSGIEGYEYARAVATSTPISSYEFLGVYDSVDDLTSYTFTGVNLGTEKPGRVIVAFVQANLPWNSESRIAPLTINGTPMQYLAGPQQDTYFGTLYYAVIPDGTTGTIEMGLEAIYPEYAAAATSAQIGLWALYDVRTAPKQFNKKVVYGGYFDDIYGNKGDIAIFGDNPWPDPVEWYETNQATTVMPDYEQDLGDTGWPVAGASFRLPADGLYQVSNNSTYPDYAAFAVWETLYEGDGGRGYAVATGEATSESVGQAQSYLSNYDFYTNSYQSARGIGGATFEAVATSTTAGTASANGVTAENPEISARYWRVYITANNGQSLLVSINELELYESQYGPNVATGGTASASSSANTGFLPAEAFDNNLYDTGNSGGFTWGSLTFNNPEWIQYDFGAGNAKSIKAIGIHGRVAPYTDQSPKDFKIQYSYDGTTWFTSWEVSNSTNWATMEFRKFVNPAHVTTPPVGVPWGLHSYWRVFVGQAADGSVPAITEIDMRAAPGSTDQCVGGTATASSQFSTSYIPAYAFDNNVSTFWSANANWGWVQYQFTSPVSVAELTIQARSDTLPSRTPRVFALQFADSPSGPWTTTLKRTDELNWTAAEIRTYTDPAYTTETRTGQADAAGVGASVALIEDANQTVERVLADDTTTRVLEDGTTTRIKE